MDLVDLHGLEAAVLLALRLLMAVLFFTSGWSHATRTGERSQSIGMSPAFTFLLGLGEMAGAVSVAVGLWAQAGAALLMGIMLGAVYKKAFVWHKGFWGKGQGWFYDLLYFWVSAMILVTGGGAYVLV